MHEAGFLLSASLSSQMACKQCMTMSVLNEQLLQVDYKEGSRLSLANARVRVEKVVTADTEENAIASLAEKGAVPSKLHRQAPTSTWHQVLHDPIIAWPKLGGRRRF